MIAGRHGDSTVMRSSEAAAENRHHDVTSHQMGCEPARSNCSAAGDHDLSKCMHQPATVSRQLTRPDSVPGAVNQVHVVVIVLQGQRHGANLGSRVDGRVAVDGVDAAVLVHVFDQQVQVVVPVRCVEVGEVASHGPDEVLTRRGVGLCERGLHEGIDAVGDVVLLKRRVVSDGRVAVALAPAATNGDQTGQ